MLAGQRNARKGGIFMAGLNGFYMNVYNSYMTSYQTKALTRYDTHKKGELKNIYNAIVKLNMESPVYNVNFSRDILECAVELKEGARGLKNTINDLTNGNTQQLFSKRTVFTDNSQTASVKYIGEEDAREIALDDFEIRVEKLATGQKNVSYFFQSQQDLLLPGSYVFNIETNHQDYEFQFSVGEGDKTEAILQKLKRMVNKSNIGLKGEILTKGGEMALEIVSNKTGDSQQDELIFTVSDNLEEDYPVVKKLGLDRVLAMPENSSFWIDGVHKSTQGNTFVAGKILEITLNGESDQTGNAVIGFKTDTESITEHIETFVNEYNSFIDLIRDFSYVQSGSEKLLREYNHIAGKYRNDLEAIGLDLLDNGNIQIDEALLVQATNDEENYTETLDGINNFKNSVLGKLNQSLINPMEYIDKVIVNYKNPGKNFPNPYITSMYSGMMFNSYC